MKRLCQIFLIDLRCGYVVCKYELAGFVVEKLARVKY